MKLTRALLIVTGILIALCVIAILLAFTPGVQTWAARRAIAHDPSLGVSRLGRIAAGLNRIELTDVVVARDGLALTLPSATVELPLLSAARGEILLRRLVAKGWTLDLAPPAASAEIPNATPPTPNRVRDANRTTPGFEGIFKLLELPIALAVESVELEGAVIFPTKSGQPPGRARVAIDGGQLGGGREGRFAFETEMTLPDGFGPVTRVAAESTLALTMDTPRTFSRIAAAKVITASGPGLPQPTQMVSETTATRAGARESYDLVLKTISASGEKMLVELHARHLSATAPIDGTWKFDLADTDLAPFALGQTLPVFTLEGAGTFQADHRAHTAQITGKTALALDQIDALQAGLGALGRLRLTSEFDVAQNGGALRVQRLAAELAGTAPIARVQALQPFEIFPASGELKVGAPEKDLLTLTLSGLPLAWAKLAAPPDLALTGEDLRGELLARPKAGGFSLHSAGPLTLNSLSVVRAGQPLVQALDLSLTLSADYAPAGWQAEVSEFTARSRGATLLTLTARAGQPATLGEPIKASGRFRADLPALLAQPFGAELAKLAAGAAEGDFTASVADPLQQFSADVSFANLRAAGSTTVLPAVHIDLRADVRPDGRVEAHVPLAVMAGERRSDLELTAKLAPAGPRFALEAQLVSRQLYIDDLQALSTVFPAEKANGPSQNPKPTVGTPDSNPRGPTGAPGSPPQPKVAPWDPITGEIQLALKKVVYAAQPPVALNGVVKITPEALTPGPLQAAFPDGANAKVEGAIRFDAKAPEPYDMNATLVATSFDPAPFLRAANPGRSPLVEGKFDFNAQVAGRAPSLEVAAEKLAIDAQLASRGGRFHGFDSSALAAKIGRGQQGLSTVAGVVGLIGGALGKDDLARGAERTRAVADSIRRLVDLQFDQLNLEVSQRPGEPQTRIKSFNLLSPDLRLQGAGTLENTPGVALLKRALALEMQMAARGDFAADLRVLGALKREADALGYTPLAENFALQGSLSQMSADALIRQLARNLKF
jgi:hypothetical protein